MKLSHSSTTLQLTLQNATTTIKRVNDRYELIHDRLLNLIDCNFLANVKPAPIQNWELPGIYACKILNGFFAVAFLPEWQDRTTQYVKFEA